MGNCVVTSSPRLTGYGMCVPEQVRNNNDPIFQWLRNNPSYGSKLFTGYRDRRVLGPGETVTSIMVRAAEQAMLDAGLGPRDIDLLVGQASVSRYISPNSLAEVHASLGLPRTTQVLPVADDFTNFNSSVVLCDSLISNGACKTCLIVCGANWTQHVDYHTPQAISAGDGAGAAVMACSGQGRLFRLVDWQQTVASEDFGAMYMAPDPIECNGRDAWGTPVMHITQAGQLAFSTFGGQTAPRLAIELMQRNGLEPAQVTMICHQSSKVLLDSWRSLLPGVRLLDTLVEFANLELAAIPVNLAVLQDQIDTDDLILLGLGIELNASALLLRRG